MGVTLTPPQQKSAIILTLASIYLVAGKFGLGLAFVNPSATAVWAPTGIALVALLLLGYEVWPGIFLGAFLVNLTTTNAPLPSFFIATGNTLEALVGCYLMTQYTNGKEAFNSAWTIFRFAFFTTIVSTVISATIGSTSLCVAGLAPWPQFGPVFLTWWLGDTTGALIVTPLLLLWYANYKVEWSLPKTVEAIVLVASIVGIGQTVFGGIMPSSIKNYPFEYLCLVALTWAGFRFGARETASAAVILAGLAIRGTLAGFGPFARASKNESLVLLQIFIVVCAVMGLTIASLVTERKEHEDALETLAGSDSLTSLANYRRFMEVLTDELHRSQRTKRAFSLLVLDMDGLKLINDKHGHLVGSRAIVRMANALKRECRTMDTAARFGGDEFAMVLPETEKASAQLVAKRVMDRVAADKEEPMIRVSYGISSYPMDGETDKQLIDIADKALYKMKRGKGKLLTLVG